MLEMITTMRFIITNSKCKFKKPNTWKKQPLTNHALYAAELVLNPSAAACQPPNNICVKLAQLA